MNRSVLLALFLTLAITGNAFSAHHVADEKKPAAVGNDVIAYLNQVDYQNWQLWPGKSKLYEGRHPHGSFLTTYVSRGAYQAIENKTGSIPSGEFVVKENYTAEKKLAAITVMYKQAGYNAEGGDWFWLKFTPDGTVEKEGKVSGCIGCHAAVRSNDWLFIGPVK